MPPEITSIRTAFAGCISRRPVRHCHSQCDEQPASFAKAFSCAGVMLYAMSPIYIKKRVCEQLFGRIDIDIFKSNAACDRYCLLKAPRGRHQLSGVEIIERPPHARRLDFGLQRAVRIAHHARRHGHRGGCGSGGADWGAQVAEWVDWIVLSCFHAVASSSNASAYSFHSWPHCRMASTCLRIFSNRSSADPQ